MRLPHRTWARAVTIGRVIDLKTLEAADFAATLDGLLSQSFLSMQGRHRSRECKWSIPV
jgi:hypothetical protein